MTTLERRYNDSFFYRSFGLNYSEVFCEINAMCKKSCIFALLNRNEDMNM